MWYVTYRYSLVLLSTIHSLMHHCSQLVQCEVYALTHIQACPHNHSKMNAVRLLVHELVTQSCLGCLYCINYFSVPSLHREPSTLQLYVFSLTFPQPMHSWLLLFSVHIPSCIILNVSAIAYTCLLTVPTLNNGASDAKFIRNTVQHVSSMGKLSQISFLQQFMQVLSVKFRTLTHHTTHHIATIYSPLVMATVSCALMSCYQSQFYQLRYQGWQALPPSCW